MSVDDVVGDTPSRTPEVHGRRDRPVNSTGNG